MARSGEFSGHCEHRIKPVVLGGFILGASLIAFTLDTSIGLDHVYSISTVVLFLAGLMILGLLKAFPGIIPLRHYKSIPLQDFPHYTAQGREPSGSQRPKNQLSVVTTIAIAAQVAPFTPFVVVLNDWLRSRHLFCIGNASSLGRLSRYNSRSSLRYLFPSLLVSFGGYLAAHTKFGTVSTYICMHEERYSHLNSGGFFYQFAVLLGNAVIVCHLGDILRTKDGRQNDGGRRFEIIGYAFIVSAGILVVAEAAISFSESKHGSGMLAINAAFLWNYGGQIVLLVCTIVLAVLSLDEIGPVGLSVTTSFVFTYFSGLGSALTNRHLSFIPPTALTVFFSLCLLFGGGAVFYFRAEASSEQSRSAPLTLTKASHKTPLWISALFITMSMLRILLEATRGGTINHHPIDTLIQEARQKHDLWLKEASTVRSLNGTVNEYRRRYDRHPPPGFDAWYDFATARTSIVIDDYDSIHNDLLPFWSLSPAELRHLTRELISDPSNDIAAIRVRNGLAWPSENVSHPYYPMLRGVTDMISGFSDLLPDMDLAINLNNDCRVAVPWSKIEKLREFGRNAGTLQWGKDEHWSVDRAKGWDEGIAGPTRGAIFENPSLKEIFLSYGAIGCPPESRALTGGIRDKHSLCLSCTHPHSLGGFVRNWTLAADICHQPDMANLHGQYMLPWRFKGTHQLLPVFSQRKLYGFNDILYPGGWLYDGTEEYAPAYSPSAEYADPPFLEKNNTLFWRGQAVEGISLSGSWKGMTPQRLVYLANDGKSHDNHAIILAKGPDGKYTHHQVSHANLHSSLPLDVAFDRNLTLCVGRDCIDQEKTFNISSKRIPFQQHWQFRYLLDIDDGLFGHFLPFLKSRSLPFRTAIFREWYDSRISAWVHFAPLDSRLHELHSTLAYFQGINTTDTARRPVRLAAHEREAEYIAESGRKWASKATREEDKLIYFFRLCLEWGRLTDDRRDEIGFQM